MADTPKFEDYKVVLRKLCECLENLSIEADAHRKVALAHGATFYEIEKASKQALADPEIRRQARADYEAMWNALEASGEAAYAEDLLQSLAIPERPN